MEQDWGVNALFELSFDLVLRVESLPDQLKVGRILQANEIALTVLGYTRQELLQLSLGDLTPTDLMENWYGWMNYVEPHRVISSNWRFLGKNGDEIPVKMRVMFLDRDAKKFLLVVADVSHLQKAESRYREDEELYQLISEHTSDLVAIMDDSRDVIYSSPSHMKVLGFSPMDDKVALLRAIHPDDLVVLQKTYLGVIMTGRTESFEVRIRNAEGVYLVFESRVSIIPKSETTPRRLTTVSIDITKRRQAENQLRELVYQDSLTKIGNRRMFVEKLQEWSDRIKQENEGKAALILIDLDGFKGVNDSFGHSVGDALLCEVAKRLSRMIGTEDSVARIGGDEFVILRQLGDLDDVDAFCAHIDAMLAEPYRIEDKIVHSSASLGLSRIPHDGFSVDTLLSRADTEMYKDKYMKKARQS